MNERKQYIKFQRVFFKSHAEMTYLKNPLIGEKR